MFLKINKLQIEKFEKSQDQEVCWPTLHKNSQGLLKKWLRKRNPLPAVLSLFLDKDNKITRLNHRDCIQSRGLPIIPIPLYSPWPFRFAQLNP